MNILLLVVLGTSIWVAVDASTMGVKKGQLRGMADMGPAGWFFVCLFLWIVGFPFYLAKRGELKRINTLKAGSAPAPTSPAAKPAAKPLSKDEVEARFNRVYRPVFEIKPPS